MGIEQIKLDISTLKSAIRNCALVNDLKDAYPMVSEETIISREPAVILIPSSTGMEPAAVGLRNGWAGIPAVKAGKVFVVDDNVYTRPGPRIADVVVELSERLSGRAR